MSRGEVVRFALVGCGNFGRFMGRFADGLERMSVAALCDSSEESLGLAREEVSGDVPAFATLEACLTEGGDAIDAVMLATPNGAHCEQAIAAAQAGKHVFCEKAMAIDTAECWRMVDAAQAAGVRLVVGHKRRLRPPFARARELALSGELGEPVAIQLSTWHHYPGIANWWMRRDQCGGLLHRVGVHDVDFMRAVLGDVEAVTALGVGDVTGRGPSAACRRGSGSAHCIFARAARPGSSARKAGSALRRSRITSTCTGGPTGITWSTSVSTIWVIARRTGWS